MKRPALPTEDESRRANLAWFSRLTPSQKIQAVERDRRFRERLSGLRIRKVPREA